MTSRMKHRSLFSVFSALFCLVSLPLSALADPAAHSSGVDPDEMRFIQVQAKNKDERSAIVNQGMSIEFTRSDSAWGFATRAEIRKIKSLGFTVLGDFDFETGRGGHEGILDFPDGDSRFHNFSEAVAELQALESANPELVKIQSIGRSIEGRDLWAIHINSSPEALRTGQSNKPGAVFLGNHHAREHLSLEIPLMLAQYLLAHKADTDLAPLLSSRDIWIIPMVNPDGAEWDISDNRYKMWRKNRRDNGDRSYGVDLNRNYGYRWGTGGSSNSTRSEIYMGPAPFSEPETQAVKAFIDSHANTKVLLSFHTFSELILYPWGHSNDPITNERDRSVFERMAQTMAGWNHYTPEQASELYIASGDTTDWAYGEHGIFAFTFELSPRNSFGMSPGQGFYPGAGVIDRVFQDNLRPALYMIDLADNPYRVLGRASNSFLPNLAEPEIPSSLSWEVGGLPRTN